MEMTCSPFFFAFLRRLVLCAAHFWLFFAGLSIFFFIRPVFADPSSTNYSVAESFFPAASEGEVTSTNYAVVESTIDYFEKTATSSTNYEAEGAIGIAGSDLIPVIQNVSPSSGRFFSDENAEFTVTAISPDNDTLEYEAKQDGTTKDGPQSSNILTWALSGSDLGRRAVTVHVSDPDGSVIQHKNEYVFRRPVK